MKKMLLIRFFLATFFNILLIFFIFPANSQDLQNQSFSKNEIIITFEDNSKIKDSVEELFDQNEKFESITGDSNLDFLNIKYKVISYERLYRKGRSFEELKRLYPERANRIPKGVDKSKISHSYKVVFKDEQDNILLTCSDFENDPNIKRAQPNHIMSVQSNIDSVKNPFKQALPTLDTQ